MTFAALPAVLVLAGVFFFLSYYLEILRPRKGTLDWIALRERRPFTFAVRRHPMERRDLLPVLLLTAAYALTAFFQLGSLTAPQDPLDLADGQVRTLAVQGEPVRIAKLRVYAALGTGGYDLETSEDGRTWYRLWSRAEDGQGDRRVYYWGQAEGYAASYALDQPYTQLLKWRDIPLDNPRWTRFLRLRGRADGAVLQLGKLILLDQDDRPIAAQWTGEDGAPLPAELADLLTADDTVPEAASWRNSAYFDEIYHVRTALEHLQGVYPYEVTHPPLGKLIIGLGIRLFGATPFGWRFMGTLFGVLMLPLFYILVKHLFGKRVLAVCGTALFASGFLHLTQTRIATLDTYGTFFVLLSYLFFYRWLTAPATPDRKGRVHEGYGQLALSGLAWGVGCACKWTVVYAGVGLALLYGIHLVTQVRLRRGREDGPPVGRWLVKTLAVSAAAFVLLPAGLYTLTYLPYAQAAGHPGLAGALDEMWRNQIHMLTYHNGVHSYHAYASRWYQWVVDGRPILYYVQNLPGGRVEKFAALTNPLTTWLGLPAILLCMARCFRRMWAKLALVWGVGLGCCGACWLVGRVPNGAFDPALAPEDLRFRLALMGGCLAGYLLLSGLLVWATDQQPSSPRCLFFSLGFLAQFLPWAFIGRTTFAYHFFPSTLFLLLAICALFNDLMDSPRARWRFPVYAVTGGSVGLYLLFYPYLTGLTMTPWYFTTFLRFLPSWP